MMVVGVYRAVHVEGGENVKAYVKPEMVRLEVRAEERFAGSRNCHAATGKTTCTSPKLWSSSNEVP